MAKLRFGISSIIGLTAALANVPSMASVQQAVTDGLAAARLAPANKYVVADMAALAELVAQPGDIVTVIAGDTGGREVREVVNVNNDGLVVDSIIIERERSIEVPVTESVVVGAAGELALQYAPVHGLASIANFGNVLHVNADTGEHSLYPVTQNEGGAYVVDAEVAGAEVVIQYSRSVTLAVSEAGSVAS